MMNKVIGIDPGLAETGIGIVEGTRRRIHHYAFGCIRTTKDQSLPCRLDAIFCRIQQILADEKPDLMVVEDVFSLPANPQSGLTLGKVAGVVILAGSRAAIPVLEVPVREAKQVLTGNGKASKEQLEAAVRDGLNRSEPIHPFHASDALALAMIGLSRYDFNRSIPDLPR
jgi:crossover junction endodeoxyribonuclease RuvC